MELDNIRYEHQKGRFLETQKHSITLLNILKNGVRINDGQATVDLESINIGSPQMANIEKFILKHVVATDANGKSFTLKKEADIESYFDTRRSHYYAVVIDGLKFHFVDFIPASFASSKHLNLAKVFMPKG